MIWAALLLGLGGSLHCAAMCGPLVFSVQTNWNIKGLSPHLLIYHLGRIAGYLLLGLAFSLVKVTSPSLRPSTVHSACFWNSFVTICF